MDNTNNAITKFLIPKENETPNERKASKASGKPKQAAKKASGKPKQAAKKASNGTIKKGSGLTTVQKAAPRRASVKKTLGLRNSNRVVLDDANQKRFYKQLAQGAIGSYDPTVVYGNRIQNLVNSANRTTHVSKDLRSAIWERDYSRLIEDVKKLNTKNKANKDELLHALQTLKSNTGMNESVDLADAFPGNETLREMVNKIPSLTGTALYRTKRTIQVLVATLLNELADKVAPGDSEAEQNLKRIFDSNDTAVRGMTRNAKRKKGNDLAKTEMANAKAKRKEADQAEAKGLSNDVVTKLKEEANHAELKAKEALAKSSNGYQNARRKESNELAKTEMANAKAKRKEADQAEAKGLSNDVVTKLKEEANHAELKAKEAKVKSLNGKRSRKFTFADGFVLDRSTLFDGLTGVMANRMNYTETKRTREIQSMLSKKNTYTRK